MRNGQRPRREPAVEDEAPVNLPVATTSGLANLTPVPANDLSGRQLALDSLDSLDEPADVLVRISAAALAGDADLDGRESLEVEEAAESPELAGTAETVEAAEVGPVEVIAEPSASAGALEVAETDEGPSFAEAAAAFDGEQEAAEKDVQLMNRSTEETAAEVDAADDYVEDEPLQHSDGGVQGEIDGAAEQSADDVGESNGGVVDGSPVELAARPMPYEPAAPLFLDDPSLQIRLARIHLKTGSLALARAELETLAGRHQLDTDAHVDLAEARWRTGDLLGAGEAAAAYLANGGQEAIGFVISAEAAAMSNQHAEARRLAEEAQGRQLAELDPLFAGITRRATWKSKSWSSTSVAAPVEPEVAQPIEFVAEPVEPEAEPEQAEVAQVEPVPAPVEPSAEVPKPAAAEAPPAEMPVARPAANAMDASTETAAGRLYLEAGDPMMAALHFGVAIRLSPESASAILEAIGDRQELPLQMVRGDALRVLGLEVDAGKAYQSVASALVAPRSVEPAAAVDAAPPAVSPAVSEEAPDIRVEPKPEPSAGTAEPEPSARPALKDLPPLRWE
jgi:hypothetical protein